MASCELCPRRCGVDRANGERGYCGAPALPRVARAALHFFEEPPISGTRGSGTVCFTGCSLRCVFCQNRAILDGECGRERDAASLADIFFALEEKGAHNINLVTPTHYVDTIREALVIARPRLKIPVVYNCGGYERVETLKTLDGLVDIYLPDFKYFDPAWAIACAHAHDYAERASEALSEMYQQVGALSFNSEGILQKGLIVRHLVLPGARADSAKILRRIQEIVPTKDIALSLMAQYTPDFAPSEAPTQLRRRVTRFEYESVLSLAEELGFHGFSQSRQSASADFTPDFSTLDLPDKKEKA